MTKKYFYFLILTVMVLVGADIQSGRLKWGSAVLNDSTSALITTNKGMLVNGGLKTHDSITVGTNIIMPDASHIYMGDHSTYPNVGIQGQINELYSASNKFSFSTVTNTNTVATLDSLSGFDLHYGMYTIRDSLKITAGSGSPESAVTAPIGSIYLRVDGSTSTTLYVKTSGSGNTGWTAK